MARSPTAWAEMTSAHDAQQGAAVQAPSQALFPLSRVDGTAWQPTVAPGCLPLCPRLMSSLLFCRSVQTFADKSKQEALKNDLVEALKRKQQC